jgi:protein-L-isoaspartate(D-aspartate) O-methyltransferase
MDPARRSDWTRLLVLCLLAAGVVALAAAGIVAFAVVGGEMLAQGGTSHAEPPAQAAGVRDEAIGAKPSPALPEEAHFVRARERMVKEDLRGRDITDARVLEAMGRVPRQRFVPPGSQSQAYYDHPLPIGHGQTISQPYIVARMTEALLAGVPLGTVMEVGTGSGYQTAVLARLANRVYSVERIEALIPLARRRFQALRARNIRLVHSDGRVGLPQYAPFDGILVAAAPEGIPLALVEQLSPGGRMVLPVGARDKQALVRVIRVGDGYESEFLEPVSFVPLVGGVN